MMLTRREALQLITLSGLALRSPHVFARSAPAPLLILIEFKGGNDVLSMLAPFADPLYVKARPGLALTKSAVRAIDDQVGFHPLLSSYDDLFRGGELAIIQGGGCPHPSLSHYRSLEIWESGSDGAVIPTDGWAARALRNIPTHGRPMDGIGVGVTGLGPGRGLDRRGFIMENPKRFADQLSTQKIVRPTSPTPALTHILETQEAINANVALVKQIPGLDRVNYTGLPFEVTSRIAQCLIEGVPTLPFLKLTHEGYDTHATQAATYALQMRDLNLGLTDLVAFLKRTGRWRDSLVVLFSEFGRSPWENVAHGTDHGTSSCLFVTGGRVRGGRYGTYPSYKNTQNELFVPSSDYRAPLAEIVADFWKLDARAAFDRRFDRFGFIKS